MHSCAVTALVVTLVSPTGSDKMVRLQRLRTLPPADTITDLDTTASEHGFTEQVRQVQPDLIRIQRVPLLVGRAVLAAFFLRWLWLAAVGAVERGKPARTRLLLTLQWRAIACVGV